MRSVATPGGRARAALGAGLLAILVAIVVVACSQAPRHGVPVPDLVTQAGDLKKQSEQDVARKSAGCVSCHTQTDSKTMHESAVSIGCTDCHGGNAGST